MIVNKPEVLFQINDFEVEYPLSNKKLIFKMDFPVYKNEVILITGISGIGKSTLFLVLKGILLKIYNCKLNGKIKYKDYNIIENYPEFLDKIIGYLGQNPYTQIMNSYVLDELAFGMENYKYSKEKINKNIIKYSNIFELSDKLQSKTKILSGGLCQRLNLASIISYEPDILLLDEPVSFLDNDTAKSFYQILMSFKGKKTIFIIEHNFEYVLPMVDKILIFEDDQKNADNIKFKYLKDSIDKEIKICKVKNQDLIDKKNNGDLYIKKDSNSNNILKEKKNLFSSKTKINFLAKDLFFRYNEITNLFENLSFNFMQGQVIGIVGSNGCGKTTLLQLMTGILRPQKGRIELFYDDNKIKKLYKFISILFQNSESLFFFPLIKDEIYYQLKNIKNMEIDEEILGTLLESDFFPFSEYIDKSGFMLSEGEKRRLGFIICCLNNKSIKLYDEPTYAQDYYRTKMMEDVINKFKKKNNLQIIVSHDMEFLNSVSDEIYIIKDKKLVSL